MYKALTDSRIDDMRRPWWYIVVPFCTKKELSAIIIAADILVSLRLLQGLHPSTD